MKKMFLLNLIILVSGCSPTEGHEPKNAAQVMPNCESSQLVVKGSLDRKSLQFASRVSSWRFTNATKIEGVLSDGPSRGASQVNLTFKQLLPEGGVVSARGYVNLDGVVMANCEKELPNSQLALSNDGQTFTFILKDLHYDPFCDDATLLKGELRGCMRIPY
jgi:hypothetical protein